MWRKLSRTSNKNSVYLLLRLSMTQMLDLFSIARPKICTYKRKCKYSNLLNKNRIKDEKKTKWCKSARTVRAAKKDGYPITIVSIAPIWAKDFSKSIPNIYPHMVHFTYVFQQVGLVGEGIYIQGKNGNNDNHYASYLCKLVSYMNPKQNKKNT